MVMEGDLTWDGEHMIQYAEDVLQNCAPKTYVISLAKVTPICSTKRKKNKQNVIPMLQTSYKLFPKSILAAKKRQAAR